MNSCMSRQTRMGADKRRSAAAAAAAAARAKRQQRGGAQVRRGPAMALVLALGVALAAVSFGPRWVPWQAGQRALGAGDSRPAVDQVYPHDESCYTQGLLFHDGFLFESCGGYKKSRLRKVELASGRTVAEVPIADELFAEGIERVGERLLMLTWREGQLLEFDLATLAHVDTYGFKSSNGQGWGIAGNGTSLVVSDGSAWLHYWDPASLREVGRVQVMDMDSGRPLRHLNELEFVGEHELLANVYGSQRVARIDARSGRHLGWLDFTGVLQRHGDPSGRPEVFNGVAYDAASRSLFVTGKWWRSLFQVTY